MTLEMQRGVRQNDTTSCKDYICESGNPNLCWPLAPPVESFQDVIAEDLEIKSNWSDSLVVLRYVMLLMRNDWFKDVLRF